jgi:hypothetical protein
VKIVLLVCCSFVFQMLDAQAVKPDDAKLTLAERYALLKSKSQSYGEYKAVKESELDALWKTIRDSIRTTKMVQEKSITTQARLNAQMDSVQLAIQQKEESIREIRYDSTHISVLGIGFPKALFKIIVLGLLAILSIGLGSMIGRMKFLKTSLKSKTEELEGLTHEYTEYKRKAMEKQIKLARDLQTELNKSSR